MYQIDAIKQTLHRRYCEKSKLSQNRGIDTKNRLTQ